MNKLIQLGNITRDLELRYTPKGTPVVDFGIAVNRVWKDENGQKQEEVTFTEWRCWGKSAETLARLFHKGKPILLEGRLAQEEWEDKQTGQKRRKTLGIVESWDFAGESRSGARSTEAPPTRSTPPASCPPAADGMEEDEIPF